MVDHFGFSASYNSVKRFAGSLIEHDPAQFDRLEFAAGEEVQVDYGEGALTRCPRHGPLSPAPFVCHDPALFATQLPARGVEVQPGGLGPAA